jgi:hypothetical protein
LATENQIPLVLKLPDVIGVFADEVLMSKSGSRVGLTFVQVYDVDASEARGQVAATVYLTCDKAKVFVGKLSQLLAVK